MKDLTKNLPILFLYLNDFIWKAETFRAVNTSAQISAPNHNNR